MKKIVANKIIRLSKIIKDQNFCIKNNPMGIDLNWPKSYAKLYYDKKLNDKFKNNRSPNILEINNQNKIKYYLWEKYFNNPNITSIDILIKEDILKIDSILKKNKFDIIIINKYKKINSIRKLLEIIYKLTNTDGIIIIENFHFNIFLSLFISFKYDSFINDYRLNRFLINNCLLEINKKEKRSYFKNTLVKIYKLFNFIILDTIVYIIKFIISKVK
tara:strand:- start:46 stop:696 length:651 start_codon:yes stop_codon:yes gene_type:complete